MKFNLLYEIKGTRMIEVTLPEGAELPNNWQDMTLTQQDEWLFGNEESNKIVFEDMDMSQVLTVREVL